MHDYEPGCPCDYCSTMDQILRNYRSDKEDAFRRMYNIREDPFPPPSMEKKFCPQCNVYYLGDSHKHRFKVHHPPYDQKPRQNTYQVRWNSELNRHPGRYQRVYNQALDMIEWQYKPWPEAEWVIYYKVSAEMIKREVASIGTKLAGKKFHTAASEALSKERFHKIERIDTPAQT